VGTPVISVVVGAVVISVIVGVAVISVVIGAVVISVVTVGTGVGVTVVVFWVEHPANMTLAVIKTAKIRKILFLSITEFSTSLLLQVCLSLILVKNFLRCS
jgi:hypothetical protein